jgi:hypothetical protein
MSKGSVFLAKNEKNSKNRHENQFQNQSEQKNQIFFQKPNLTDILQRFHRMKKKTVLKIGSLFCKKKSILF